MMRLRRAVPDGLGRLHDLGKFAEAFQGYLWDCRQADQGIGFRPTPGTSSLWLLKTARWYLAGQTAWYSRTERLWLYEWRCSRLTLA